LGWLAALPVAGRAEPLPFQHKAEVYREKDTGVMVFALRLEQPFLAEEFEKSNYLRLQPQDHNAYLIYPRDTRSQQKTPDFYGRPPAGLAPPAPDQGELEAGLYGAFTGSLAIQEALQYQALTSGSKVGDLTLHVSELSPPPLQSLPYARLLEEKAAKGVKPKV